MSMVINLVEDHNIYLCEGGPVYNGGVQPTPITYLTQWKIVGNSEVHGNEIWSCGEYNPTDGKYHILVQPLGGSIADIALTEPLRKVNDVADTIEFPSETEGKALVTRPLVSVDAAYYSGAMAINNDQVHYRYIITIPNKKGGSLIVLTPRYTTSKSPYTSQDKGISCGYGATNKSISFYNDDYCQSDSASAFRASLQGNELIYELATPTTELVDAPQIEEAESYSCVISQGGKAVSWSEFLYYSGYLLTDSENNILVDSENNQLTVQS